MHSWNRNGCVGRSIVRLIKRHLRRQRGKQTAAERKRERNPQIACCLTGGRQGGLGVHEGGGTCSRFPACAAPQPADWGREDPGPYHQQKQQRERPQQQSQIRWSNSYRNGGASVMRHQERHKQRGLLPSKQLQSRIALGHRRAGTATTAAATNTATQAAFSPEMLAKTGMIM